MYLTHILLAEIVEQLFLRFTKHKVDVLVINYGNIAGVILSLVPLCRQTFYIHFWLERLAS